MPTGSGGFCCGPGVADGTERWYFGGVGRVSGLEAHQNDHPSVAFAREGTEVCDLQAAAFTSFTQHIPLSLAFDAGTVGVREILLAGSVIGIGVVLIAWGVLGRRKDVPGHARDSAEKLTRDLIDELESRAERLEKLIERADTTLMELRESERRAAAAPSAVQQIPRRADTIVEPKPREQHSIFTDPVHVEVCALAEQGLGPVDIARRMQLPTGQVELILNLRSNRGTRPS